MCGACCTNKSPIAKTTRRKSDHPSIAIEKQAATLVPPSLSLVARSASSPVRTERTSRLTSTGSARGRGRETGRPTRINKKTPPVVDATEHDTQEMRAQVTFAKTLYKIIFLNLRKARVTPTLCLLSISSFARYKPLCRIEKHPSLWGLVLKQQASHAPPLPPVIRRNKATKVNHHR